MRMFSVLLSVFYFCFLVAPTVFAAEFMLTRIGSLQTEGKIYNTWYYTGLSPGFTGTGTAGSEVVMVFDEASFKTTVDDNGIWKFVAKTPFDPGDHYVSFASEEESFGFNIILGENVPESKGGELEEELPVSGAVASTILASVFGSSLIGASYLLSKRKYKI